MIRESGDLRETPGITLLGPKGKLTISQGVIVAHRHIHMHPDDAKRMGVIDKERVTVTVHGERELDIFQCNYSSIAEVCFRNAYRCR